MSCPTTLHAGASVTCDVTVTNEGPGTATATVLAVRLPSVVSESSCSGGCSVSGNSAVWDFGSLATGAVESVSVTFTVGTPAKPISFWVISAKATTTAIDPLPFAGQTAVHVKVIA
jgi:hypothetical protein